MKSLIERLDEIKDVRLDVKLKVYSTAYYRISKRYSKYSVGWIKDFDNKKKAIDLTYRFIRRYKTQIKSNANSENKQ